MKPDYIYHVADPEVIGQQDNMLNLRFQTVGEQQGQHRRSGKHIHLELTPAFAMHLLGLLRRHVSTPASTSFSGRTN